MSLKPSYRKRLLIYFAILVTIFAIGIILFEQRQIKESRTQNLEYTLDDYSELIHRFMEAESVPPHDEAALSKFIAYLPSALRVTIVSSQGKVLFDNKINKDSLGNHLDRPEMEKAIREGAGGNIRRSASNHSEYLYYAKKYAGGYFIRVALPHDVRLKSIINQGSGIAFFILLFFVSSVIIMVLFANKFSKSIYELKDFSLSLKDDQSAQVRKSFPDDEVGEISANIMENYNLLQENRRKLSLEREKLLKHFQSSDEGIAIFSKERKPVYSNSHFLQYLNLVLLTPIFEIGNLFSDPAFADVAQFLDAYRPGENVFSKRVERNGKQFNLRVIIFDDESFELNISDITRAEKTRLLKQEMTNNIAHELRTPVTSIRGYLETMLNLDENDQARRSSFLERAYAQTIRLSELIQDISLLTKIEEAPDKFENEAVNLHELLADLETEISPRLSEKNIRFTVDAADDITINGSRTLLYSIFRNLTENALAYAGSGINIVIRCYMESPDAYYFEFYDTGVGVDEKHLVRIFERFYRINEGRTRNTGGSGLGLSIVKNAVLFHRGSIVAMNRREGGLSFSIIFPKTERQSEK